MKDAFEVLSRAIPFLAQYPFWLRALAATWVLTGAVIVVSLILAHPQDERTREDVRVSLSAILWKIEQLQAKPDDSRTRSLVMILNLSFVNETPHYTRAKAIRVMLGRPADVRQWQFMPQITIDFKALMRELGKADTREKRERILETVLEGPFAPPMVPGKGSIEKSVVFAPPDGFPLKPSELREGDYTVTVACGDDERNLRTVTTVNVGFSDKRKAVLDSGNVFSLPVLDTSF